MNLKTQGFILLDVDVVALNNAGKSTNSNFDNAVATKKIFKNGRTYTYVSGQAWRYWWREALQKNHGWQLSPVTRETKIAFTAADPIKYADDDIFGYMKAAKDVVVDEQGKPILDKKGKEQKEDVTVTRVSPLKNSVIVSVGATRPVENWSSMARQDGDSVPYSKEEYSSIMKGMFSLDIAQVGTFATYNKTGFKNLTEKLKETALSNGAREIDDPFVKDVDGNAKKLVQLLPDVRKQRIKDTIQALKTISGGAMQTNNMGDVTPKFIVLATMTTGNHPFSHIAASNGVNNEKTYLNIEGIKEVLKDYKEQFQGAIFIGRRSGFMDEYAEELKSLEAQADGYPKVQIGSINETIDNYCKQLEDQIV
ncbi:type I-B CRISPR-associated protein Cas7/Cst2/DevR [Niastella populi]|uniref:Type I-B CRISPR-associated protein Cas7/Cst2/DevR n=1 Tax=Niastella populi TaxID=550983 RepID=A0A1V9FN55_9BACT|nr:type I-B CRISPR-associated protein Cas7/Cst2/DevR [Niastella populi]OQP59772.1 type I-B CRISPR-associated protein Cas7/Cst2/DevR [Niastella populi]